MKNPRVSILLTTYNRPQFLKRAVESLFAQTYRDFEILILDDNSDNEEQLRLLDIYNEYDIIRVFKSSVKPEDRRKKTRYSVMINVGLREAKGEFISYNCDDDHFYPEKLEKMISYLDHHQEANVVYGSQNCILQYPDGREEIQSVRRADRTRLDASCNVDHSSVIMRASTAKEIGDWNEDPSCWGAADAEYWERLNKAGHVFYPIDDVLDAHVYHDGSWTKDGNWTKLGTKEEYGK